MRRRSKTKKNATSVAQTLPQATWSPLVSLAGARVVSFLALANRFCQVLSLLCSLSRVSIESTRGEKYFLDKTLKNLFFQNNLKRGRICYQRSKIKIRPNKTILRLPNGFINSPQAHYHRCSRTKTCSLVGIHFW